jgi:putative heme-binding domain-containing protein
LFLSGENRGGQLFSSAFHFMPSFRNSSQPSIVIAFLLWAAFCIPFSYSQQDDSLEDDFKTGPSPGQETFSSSCAGCHGLDGQGSDKAPGIAAKAQRLSDAQLSNMVSKGVAGTGMPAFRSLTPDQLRSLVEYLHTLQGKLAARAMPGDAASGKQIFIGKGGCSSCHTMAGKGGFIGPDLTNYGTVMSAASILKAILSPVRVVPIGYKSAAVTTRSGDHIEGVVRNEDNFSVQVQATDGSFHFFQKSDLRSLQYLDRSLMPTNYSERLSQAELNDLASYLMSAGSSSKAAQGTEP